MPYKEEDELLLNKFEEDEVQEEMEDVDKKIILRRIMDEYGIGPDHLEDSDIMEEPSGMLSFKNWEQYTTDEEKEFLKEYSAAVLKKKGMLGKHSKTGKGPDGHVKGTKTAGTKSGTFPTKIKPVVDQGEIKSKLNEDTYTEYGMNLEDEDYDPEFRKEAVLWINNDNDLYAMAVEAGIYDENGDPIEDRLDSFIENNKDIISAKMNQYKSKKNDLAPSDILEYATEEEKEFLREWSPDVKDMDTAMKQGPNKKQQASAVKDDLETLKKLKADNRNGQHDEEIEELEAKIKAIESVKSPAAALKEYSGWTSGTFKKSSTVNKIMGGGKPSGNSGLSGMESNLKSGKFGGTPETDPYVDGTPKPGSEDNPGESGSAKSEEVDYDDQFIGSSEKPMAHDPWHNSKETDTNTDDFEMGVEKSGEKVKEDVETDEEIEEKYTIAL